MRNFEAQATADIEGILVRSAQGVRGLTEVISEKSDSGEAPGL